jgi:hypothetical protein
VAHCRSEAPALDGDAHQVACHEATRLPPASGATDAGDPASAARLARLAAFFDPSRDRQGVPAS